MAAVSASRSHSTKLVARAEYTRPWLADYQREALFGEKRYGIVEGSTKCGKTAPCLIWLAEQAMAGKRGQNFWWVAPVYPQAEIAYRRMKRGLPSELMQTHDSDRWVELPNGARMWFKSAEKPDNLYGEDVYAAVIDEASRCREESWHAVRSTLTATRGPVRIIGNVKGRRNWAYAMARKAEAGEPNMSYSRITAYDAIEAGILDQEEIDQARADLPEAVFRELYLAEPSEDGGNPFGISAIAACVGPMSIAPPTVWGWDLAKYTDWTVGIALDASGVVCRMERFQKPWEETTDRIIEVTRGMPALIDSTGVGDPILERLQKQPGSRFDGYQFTSPSKQKLMEGLAVAIQRSEIVIPNGPIRKELEEFEFKVTRTGVSYSAPEGFHDDCVCSLALAVMHKSHVRQPLMVTEAMLSRFSQPRRY